MQRSCAWHTPGLGSSPFARRYLGNLSLISSPAGTQMVHFPAFPRRMLFCSLAAECHPDIRVTPFGHPGLFGYWLLPPAFRSLSRPSSSGGSQASSVDPFSLDHIILPVPFAFNVKKQVEIRGFEPLTPGLQSRCSSQLSYIPRPDFKSNRKERIKNYKSISKTDVFFRVFHPAGHTTLLPLFM